MAAGLEGRPGEEHGGVPGDAPGAGRHPRRCRRRLRPGALPGGAPLRRGTRDRSSSSASWTNISLGTLANVRFPSDVAASERYFIEEIVKDPIRLVSAEHVEPLPGPGFGTEIDPVQLVKYTVKTEVLPA